MATFYYTKGGEEVFGPVPEDDLRQMREARILRATAMVCRAGERTWKPIGEAVGSGEASSRGVTPSPSTSAAEVSLAPGTVAVGSTQEAAGLLRPPNRGRVWNRFWRYGLLLTILYFLSMYSVYLTYLGGKPVGRIGLPALAETLGNALGVVVIAMAVSFAFRQRRRFLVRVCGVVTLLAAQWITLTHDAHEYIRWGRFGSVQLAVGDQNAGAMNEVNTAVHWSGGLTAEQFAELGKPDRLPSRASLPVTRPPPHEAPDILILDTIVAAGVQLLRSLPSAACSVPESIGVIQATIAEVRAEQTAAYQLGRTMMRGNVEAWLPLPDSRQTVTKEAE